CALGYACAQGFCQSACADHDSDGVGFGPMCSGVQDCNDEDPAETPGKTEGPHGSPSCSDGKDNDCNGLTDAQEPSCRRACWNGIDDDGDGLVDMDDPGCASPDDADEHGTMVCDNGFDDDNDGKMDFHADGTGDPGCSSPYGTSELSGGACN